jgi:hypothetical protein
VGGYEIVRQVGSGGMAELYLARAPTGVEGVGRLVALKRMLPELARDAEFADMFHSEARLAATLRHPNIASLFELGTHEGVGYFTMEYVHGMDLGRLLRVASAAGRGLRMSHALTIVSGVAAGLHAAHEARDGRGKALGIVHRDVSPSNILIGYDGAVKLVDFGIAKALGRRTTTRTGHVRGKLGYLSPEQCAGDPLDCRSDVFSLGVVLYELTTGQRLFDGGDDAAIMKRLLFDPVEPPSRVRGGYPDELEAIVLRALARQRDERYGSAEELGMALEDFSREHKLSLTSAGLARLMREIDAEGIVLAENFAPARSDDQALAATEAPEERSRGAEVVRPPPARLAWWIALGAGLAAVVAIVLATRDATETPSSAEAAPSQEVAPLAETAAGSNDATEHDGVAAASSARAASPAASDRASATPTEPRVDPPRVPRRPRPVPAPVRSKGVPTEPSSTTLGPDGVWE